MLRLRGGDLPDFLVLDRKYLDASFNYDFRTRDQLHGVDVFRGGLRYERPYGWFRLAINVSVRLPVQSHFDCIR